MRITSALVVWAVLTAAAVVSSASPSAAAPTRHEAETAPATCSGTIDSDHTGFSGAGFCNGSNAAGASVQFSATASAATSAAPPAPHHPRSASSTSASADHAFR